MAGRRWRGLGTWGLALGYFAWYVPYSALTKALSSGILPGFRGAVGVRAMRSPHPRTGPPALRELNGALYSGSGGA